MAIPLLQRLDIPTLTIALSAVYAGSVLYATLLYAVRRTFPGARLWILGQVFMSIGAFGVVAQAQGLPYSTLAVSNIGLLASVVLMAHAIWRFRFGTRFPVVVYLVVPLGLVVWYLMVDSPIALRIIAYSGTLSILSCFVAVLLLIKPRGDPYGNIYRLTSIYFIMVSVLGLVRTIGAVSHHAPQSIAETGAMGGIEYLVALFAAFFNLFGYFLLSSARSERDLHVREGEIRHRNEELLETIATKDALIAVIGHDLRAPVWSATRYVRGHLVEFDGDLNSKRESIETLAEGLERISGLLDSLLEWALCASGRIKLEMKPVRIDEVVAEASADVATTAVAKGILIDGPVVASTIVADHRALATVLRNLLSNAVKYSRNGSTVRIRVTDDTDKIPARRLIIIEDNGVGMKSDQVARLFVPGRTILTLGTSGEQGRGFGLAISKLFVEAMGGEIHIESEYGAGTRFVLDFPIPVDKP